MITLDDIQGIRARFHTFNTVHNTFGLWLPDSVIEESLHLIHQIERIAQCEKFAQQTIDTYLQAWRPIYLRDTGPSDDRKYANSFVLTRNPVMLYEYDERGKSVAIGSTVGNLFLKSWLDKLSGLNLDPEQDINHAIYQIEHNGLNKFNSVIREHKSRRGNFLLIDSHQARLEPPERVSLQTALPPEFVCLGTQAVARIIDHTLRILATTPHIDSRQFIHHFLGAFAISCKTLYQDHGVAITNGLLTSCLAHISMNAVKLSTEQLDHYEAEVLNLARIETLELQHTDQYPPAQLEYDLELDRAPLEDDLVNGSAFKQSYRSLRKKAKDLHFGDSEFTKVGYIANSLDTIRMADTHSIEWRLHRQWRELNQQISLADHQRTILQRLVFHKNLRQRCLETIREDLVEKFPELKQVQVKPTPNVHVIENSNHEEAQARPSFNTSSKSTQLPSQSPEALSVKRSSFRLGSFSSPGSGNSNKVKPLDHYASSFNHYYHDENKRTFFQSPNQTGVDQEEPITVARKLAFDHESDDGSDGDTVAITPETMKL